ncbi:MAG: J domain-containing protein [Planctomycetota bacterium]
MSRKLTPDHYQTLKVERDASNGQIQAAFRQLAKRYHPDKNPRRVAWAESKMHQILEAYQVLSDNRRRTTYDRQLNANRPGHTVTERIRRKKDDLTAQAGLLFHHLLQGEHDQALDLYEQLTTRRITFSLRSYLDERDYRDALFLLGEAYEERRQWRTALRFYWEAYEREKKNRKRYFFDELKDRLRVLFSQRLVRGLEPEQTLENYHRALELGIPKRDAALIYKKIASVHDQLGHRDEAVEALDKAQALCPGMKTLHMMREKIAGN